MLLSNCWFALNKVERIEVVLLSIYILISCYFLIKWLRFHSRIPKSSLEDGFLSFVVLVVTTILWPLAIPLFVWKLLKPKLSLPERRLEQQSEVEPNGSTATVAAESSNLPAL